MSSKKQDMSIIPVIIDCDTGTDDALALCGAFNSSEWLDVRAVTCVSGNGSVDSVLNATLKVLDACNVPSSTPVARGCECGLIEQPPACTMIHGEDSLGDLVPPLPTSSRSVSGKPAAVLITDILRESNEMLTIVALGPLTNIAVAIRLEPELLRAKVKRLFWMGGGISLGNYRAYSEANAAYDPEAAHIVFNFGIPVTMYPWDAFLKIEVKKHDLELMSIPDVDSDLYEANSHPNKLNNAQLLCSRLMYREMRLWNQDFALIGDAAVIFLLSEEDSVFKAKLHHVAVELCHGHTRGMTVVDRRSFVDEPDIARGEPNVDVVISFDASEIKQRFLASVFGDAMASRVKSASNWVVF